jgi:hypothetical protein
LVNPSLDPYDKCNAFLCVWIDIILKYIFKSSTI